MVNINPIEEKKESPLMFMSRAIKKFKEIINYINGKQETIYYITQTGTNACVIGAVIKDEIGFGTSPTSTRLGAGSYSFTGPTAIFTGKKVNVKLQNVTSGVVVSNHAGTNTVEFDTYWTSTAQLDDGAITGNILTITVYRS